MNAGYRWSMVLLLVCVSRGAAQTTGAAAEAAAQNGDRRGALQLYTQALRATHDTVEQKVLIRKLFELAATLDPAPALPDSAMIHEVRGQTAFNEAKGKDDFVRAALEFRKAIDYAPWVARYYFNIAVLLEKAGDTKWAAAFYNVYLSSPSIADREQVQRKLIALQYDVERTSEANAPYAEVDKYLGDYDFYTKNQGLNQKLTHMRCYLLAAQCGDWKREAEVLASVVHNPAWEKVGSISLTRRGDTLFVQGSRIAFHGILKGPTIESATWYYHSQSEERWAHCSGFSTTGAYPANMAAIEGPGGPEFHLTGTLVFPNVMGNCALIPNPEYTFALAKP